MEKAIGERFVCTSSQTAEDEERRRGGLGEWELAGCQCKTCEPLEEIRIPSGIPMANASGVK
jgi:hypothetical protein